LMFSVREWFGSNRISVVNTYFPANWISLNYVFFF
jgi:hypothetical protein